METIIQERPTSTDIESPVLEIIKTRRSKRAYADKQPEQEKIRALFEAARWAPSSMNEQPWTYIYATKDQPELYEKLLNALNESNRIWASHAPLLILSMSRKKIMRNGVTNGSAKYDLGTANAFLSLQATELGLNVHQMGGYDKPKAISALNIPEDDYELGVILAIGYSGSPDELPDHLKIKEVGPRKRFTTESFAFNTSF